MFKEFDKQKFIDELEKGLGDDGDLVLGIYCRKCNAQFELNNESVAWAIMMQISLAEYIRYVQNSKCLECKINEITNENH